MKLSIKIFLTFELAVYQIFGQGVATATFTEYEPGYNQIRKTKQADSQSTEFIYQAETYYDRYIETTYTYPFDYTDATSLAMVAKNMVGSPITKTIELVRYNPANNTEVSRTPIFYEKTTYNNFGTNILPNFIEYKIGTGVLRKIVTFVNYDNLGNLTNLLELNGKTTTATYYNTTGKRNLVQTITEPLTMVSNIDYLPLVGIASEQMPNGISTSYDYDSFFRLKFIKDNAGDIVSAFHYHYKGEAIPTATGIGTLPTNKNYVVSQTPRVKSQTLLTAVESTKTSLQYLNDLGQNLQSITYKASPDKTKDIVNGSIIYNVFGQEWKAILPCPSSANTGDYEANAPTMAGNFYNDIWAYNENIYEKAAINRPSQQYNAGLDLRGGSPAPKQYYYETAGTDIPLYTVLGNSVIKGSTTYPANSLFKTRIVDEAGGETIEIKDIDGKTIQSSTKLETGLYATTHYVYNDLNQLKAVIQPEAYPLATDLAFTADHLFFNNYDDKGRIIEKKIPGADLEYIVYDQWDRPVLSQTALQRLANKWSFTKYDALNRPILMGEKVFAGQTHAQLQATAMADTDHSEAYDNNAAPIYYGYTLTFPSLNLATDAIYQINYYDNYGNWATDLGYLAGEVPHAQANAKGMLTGTKVLNQVTGNTWLRTANYYDYKGRLIQTHKEQHLATTADICSYEYNFAGETLTKKHRRRKPDNTLLKETHNNTLDHLGRLLINNHSIDDKPTNVANYEYDPIGRLKTKLINSKNDSETTANGDWSSPAVWLNGQLPTVNSLVRLKHSITIPTNYKAYASTLVEHPSGVLNLALNSYLYLSPSTSTAPLQKIDIAHHIRGGLLGVNLDAAQNPNPNAGENDLFSYKLAYGLDNNITSQSWKNAGANQERSWTYSYDGASRLTAAIYAPNGSYSLSGISYDKNGNIKTLARNGIDDLKYDYIGNRLNYVKDDAANTAGFKDNPGGGTSPDYTYWDDGSLKSDRNKGIFQIDYDTHLKKVTKISFNSAGTDFVRFYYAGDGTLLRRESSIPNNKWDYTDGLIYKNNIPYQTNTAEGRAVYNGTDWEYEFEYRDIWGNLRQSFKNNGGVIAALQGADFDMLGLELNKTTIPNTNLYKFQKQERIEDFGLDIDMFKYRPSDSQIGRFWMIDPLASDYAYNSPYALQENKFGLGVELEGKEIVAYPNLQGELYKAAGFSHQPNDIENRELGAKLLKEYVKTIGKVMLMAAPIEEAVIGGIGFLLKEGGFLLKAESILIKTGGQEAKSSASLDKLNRSLASESQVSEIGETIAGSGSKTPLRKANDMAAEYGGSAKDYAKKRSSSYTSNDGTKIETHWEENTTTGARYNIKTKLNNEQTPVHPGKRYQEKLNKIKQ